MKMSIFISLTILEILQLLFIQAVLAFGLLYISIYAYFFSNLITFLNQESMLNLIKCPFFVAMEATV